MLSYEEAHRLFQYRNGKLIWKVTKGHVRAGTEAGYYNPNGYIQVGVNGRSTYAHRIVILMHRGHLPLEEVDHKNKNKHDNRIRNLREVTSAQNKWYRGKARGTSLHKRDNLWRARIRVNGKQLNLGYFKREIDAHRAYLRAKKRMHK